MNYRHAYHAGNFADVFKHVILTALTQSFLRKENPFFYLDTHAGLGHYDLYSPEAQKSKEYENGILKIVHQDNLPPLIQDYLNCIETINTEEMRFYPGSPYFVKYFLRKNDKMLLSELHPEDHLALKKRFSHDARIAVHHQDAYQSLKAFLPPKERRGFVLIDPPYEKSEEMTQLIKTIKTTLKRWQTGVYALWYPIKNQAATDRWLKTFKEKINMPLLATQLSIYDHSPIALNGCGMVIINPPWQLDQTLQTAVPWLWDKLSIHQQGNHEVTHLP